MAGDKAEAEVCGGGSISYFAYKQRCTLVHNHDPTKSALPVRCPQHGWGGGVKCPTMLNMATVVMFVWG